MDADQDEIRQLQLRYAEAFDARDADAFAAVYTPDAIVVQHTGHRFSGHEKLRKAVSNMPPRGEGFHRVGETETRVDGDSATARCGYLARTADGRMAEGHYLDEYRRTDDGWRIARREVHIDRWLDSEPLPSFQMGDER